MSSFAAASTAGAASASASAAKPRLMISQMELENFKSYAGLQRIGPFHKCFSSIVGPNGSGKSNVIDALLFVFGKRATQMRLKKVSELIHRSNAYPNLDFARVSVYFQLIVDDADDSEGYTVVENSPFVITRIAYSSNQSKYLVNNKTSSFGEIATMLKSHAIDLENNRFLILQGEVEQIAMMRPKGGSEGEVGLLEYLEEIIGSNMFVEQIEQASKELEVVNEQRAEKVHRLKVAERERDNLSEAKCEAELFLEKEREIRKQKNLLYQVYESVARVNGQEMDGRLTTLNEKLSSEKEKLTKSEAQFTTLRTEYEQAKKEYDAISKELSNCTTQYAAFERRDVKLQEDLKHVKTNLKKQETVIEKESKKEKESDEEKEKLTTQINKYAQTLKEFEERKKEEERELQSIVEGLQEETRGIREELEAVQRRQGVEEEKVAALVSERDLITERLSLVQARTQRAKAEKERCEEKLLSLSTEEQTLTQSLATHTREKEQETASLTAQRERLGTLTENVSRSERELRELRREVESERAVVQASLSGQRENAAVRAVLSAQRERNGPLSKCGIIGRLGDLATIPSRLDVALSTACRSLDAVLVRDTPDAQNAVQFLRSRNLGRVTFVIASQITPIWLSKSRANIAIPEGCERLFDCVENVGRDCDNERDRDSVRAALYFSMRDTLVAPNLDSAVKVAFGGEKDGDRDREKTRWRVVTVDGQLVEASGAMCGGGSSQRRGAMTLSESIRSQKRRAPETNPDGENDVETRTQEQHMKAQERAIAEKEEQLSALRREREACERECERLTQSLREREREIQKLNLALTRLQETKSSLSTRLPVLRNEEVLTPEEVRDCERESERLRETEALIERASPELAELKKESARLQRQVLSVGGVKLQKAQAKVDSLQTQVESLSLSLSHKQVELTQCERAREKTLAALNKAREEKQKLVEKAQALAEEQKTMEDEALAVVEALEAAKAQRETLQTRLEERSIVFDTLQKETEKMKKIELDLLADKERLEKEREKERESEKHWAKMGEEVRARHCEEEKELHRVLRATTEEVLGVQEEKKNEDAMDVDDEDASHTSHAHTLPVLSTEDLQSLRAEDLKRDINVLEAERNKLKGNINMNALLDYLRKDANYKLRLRELEAMNAQRAALKDRYEALRRERLSMFMSGFGAISLRLKEMYQMITLGGDAELELLDSLDPFSEGISFSVRPPKKSWKAIANLSGGEKTLSSLSLVFALHAFKPTPLYVMDEIDAALDFKNVSIVANYIKERTKNAQFVVISLRNNMFELADRLVGIYKTRDATKSVTINPTLFANAMSLNDSQSAQQSQTQREREPHKLPLQDATNRIP